MPVMSFNHDGVTLPSRVLHEKGMNVSQLTVTDAAYSSEIVLTSDPVTFMSTTTCYTSKTAGDILTVILLLFCFLI